uniref:chitinase n=1 Tax=Aegilops tauschii TaxID=37682 RepID=N1R5P5_AEGTA
MALIHLNHTSTLQNFGYLKVGVVGWRDHNEIHYAIEYENATRQISSPETSILRRDQLVHVILLTCFTNGKYTGGVGATDMDPTGDGHVGAVREVGACWAGLGYAKGLAYEVEAGGLPGANFPRATGGWPAAPDGPYAWGYCFKQEQGSPGSYCEPKPEWPCASGKKYYGRGPIQLSWNYNYGPAGRAIGVDLLNNPDLVAADATVSFKTALWFWMTAQANKPSSHAVITGQWTPSGTDNAAGRVPGYGVITNIINGGLECGRGQDDRVANRIGFYKRYCDVLGVGYGNNLDCYNQRPFNSGLSMGLATE